MALTSIRPFVLRDLAVTSLINEKICVTVLYVIVSRRLQGLWHTRTHLLRESKTLQSYQMFIVEEMQWQTQFITVEHE